MSGKSPAASAAAGGGSSSSASIDTLSIQRLMSRLLLRPPYLDTNSYLSHTLDDFILSDDAALDLDLGLSDDDDDDGLDDELKLTDGPRRGRLAKEEAKLEKEIIRLIHSPAAAASLKPNSGDSVAIGDHNVCVGSHEDPGSEYRIWEWHGHIMFFDDEDGYSPEYVYGNYFERVVGDKGKMMNKVVVEEEEEEIEEVVNSGLRDLIADPKDLPWGAGGRVLHRSSLNGGLGAAR